jgi:YidC/Oxa1 family membrane protein insertase
MLTAVLVRLSILKLFINASDQAGRLAQASPRMKPLQEAVTAAKAAQDTSAMMSASQNLRAVMKEEGVSYVKMFGPFLQIFLGYGTFRLMKAMAALPVPGLDQGGFLWLMDLTIPDPYYVLPVLTSVTMFYTFKVDHTFVLFHP